MRPDEIMVDFCSSSIGEAHAEKLSLLPCSVNVIDCSNLSSSSVIVSALVWLEDPARDISRVKTR
jgi:hypothetical protein